MAVTKEKKADILKDLDTRFSKAESIYFTDYRGLSVTEMGDLRRKLREGGVDYKIAKKTLMRLSLKNANLPEAPEGTMSGPVGAAFGYDDTISPVKILYTFSKENDKLKILGGLIEGRFISQEEALELAKLPSREELLAKLVGSMQAPISGFHGVASGLLRNLVYVLKAVGENKPADQASDSKEEIVSKPADTDEPKAEASVTDTDSVNNEEKTVEDDSNEPAAEQSES